MTEISHHRRILRVEGIHLAADALAQREAQLQLGRRLVDLVDDQRVLGEDVAVLEAPPSDAGGDDDDVPGGSVRNIP